MLKQLTLSLTLCILPLSAPLSAAEGVANVPVVRDVPMDQKTDLKTDLKKTQKKAQQKDSTLSNDSQAVAALASRLESIQTLSARFDQNALKENGRNQSQSGELQLKRPNMYRWLTREPFRQEIIARDGKVWNIDHDLMQVVIQGQNPNARNTPVQLLSGNARAFLQTYRVSRVVSKGNETYTLKPMEANDLFEQLEIRFTQGRLAAMAIQDSLGGERQIKLEEVSINAPLSDSLFQVSLPRDYDLIDETQGSRAAER